MLTGMEDLALHIILIHPEYHGMLDDPERYQHKDYLPEMGDTNPFLHMRMHMAIKEQLSIDQPAGIRERFERLLKKAGDEHIALHHIMECLAEMIWQAQRSSSEMDASVYFDCLDRQQH